MEDELKRIFKNSKEEIAQSWTGSSNLWNRIETSLRDKAEPLWFWKIKVLLPVTTMLLITIGTAYYLFPRYSETTDLSKTDLNVVLDEYASAINFDNESYRVANFYEGNTENDMALNESEDVLDYTLSYLEGL